MESELDETSRSTHQFLKTQKTRDHVKLYHEGALSKTQTVRYSVCQTESTTDKA